MKNRKLYLGILVAVLSLSVIFAGCGQKNSTTSNETNTPAANQSAEPIVLGVATALGNAEGADSLRTAQLAVDEINAAGGVEIGGVKRPFKIESIDTREGEPGTPITEALNALEKLILEKKPVAIVVGGYRSEALLSSMDLIAKYKIPLITTTAMTAEFEKKIQSDRAKYKYVFRTGANVQALVGMLTKTFGYIGETFKFNKIYIINEDLVWAKGTTGALEKWAKANGWEVVGHDSYPSGSSDFSASVNKAKSSGAQLIVPIFDMPQAGVLLKQIKTAKIPALIAGYISPASTAGGWKTFNNAIEGMVNFNYELGSMTTKAIPKSLTFQENYTKKYGAAVTEKLSGHGPGPAYENVYILADAIKRAGSLDGDALASAVEKTDMDGIIGKMKFNEDHQLIFNNNPAEGVVSVAFQWEAPGKRVIVYPDNLADKKIELPSYMKK